MNSYLKCSAEYGLNFASKTKIFVQLIQLYNKKLYYNYFLLKKKNQFFFAFNIKIFYLRMKF